MWNTQFWNELDDMRRDLEDLFERSGYSRAGGSFPLMNAYEDADAYTLVAEIPGVKKEDVHITYENGVLTISGKRNPHLMKDDVALLRHEIAEGEFSKSYRLPAKVDESLIKAHYEDGILTITIQKSDEFKAKRIEIQS